MTRPSFTRSAAGLFGAMLMISCVAWSGTATAAETAHHPSGISSQAGTQALTLLRNNARQGDIMAQFYLGQDYVFGQGVPQNYTEAAEWWRKAAEQGDPVAQTDLGWLYFQGRGVPQDYTEAAKWWRKAANSGNAKAQAGLAWLYTNGMGIKKHNVEAAKWAILAKAGGFERASGVLTYLESQMTRTQIMRAQRMADQWWAAHHQG